MRLSVAVWPPPEIVEVLGALHRAPGPQWSVPAQWLVKLRPLGTVPERLVPDLVEALTEELDGAPAARCRLGPRTRSIGQWLGVPVSGLDDLAAAVFDATAPIVAVTHPQPFQADVVIARGRVPASAAGEPISGGWVADRIVLVADRSAPGRPRFEDLAGFELDRPA
ncbi:2'-5' RNA ligase family protein [Lentzea sp. NPDC051213]|uniref:2'-5' RNA ligase family protein n=1 Tax=Lentzea sp. NPDC051213 TaxID=3364126 RepID=UPI0037B15D74